jgi:formamidopyrimidine-DNA glycosylase
VPELPEVETIARGLQRVLPGKRIERVEILWHRTVDARSLAVASMAGDAVRSVGRIGKFVAMTLASGRTLVIHLRMTGRLTVVDNRVEPPYLRFAMRFTDGTKLAFSDARKFGRIRLLAGRPEDQLGIGIDPLSPRLDDRVFASLLARRTTPIKVWLLDQRKLAGVGNIYACEALYRARVRPRTRAGRLTKAARRRLLRSLRAVLQRAIARRGSSVDDYVDAEGLKGGFQNLLAVYGRAGQPCRRCRTPIKRIELAQRGTFFCPACQR